MNAKEHYTEGERRLKEGESLFFKASLSSGVESVVAFEHGKMQVAIAQAHFLAASAAAASFWSSGDDPGVLPPPKVD